MNLAEFENLLKSRRPSPVTLVSGTETFLRGEALRMIKQAAGDADLLQLEPATLEPGALINDLYTPDLFAPTRVIVIDGAESLLATALQTIAGYAAAPSSTAHLVLIVERFDGRKKENKDFVKAPSVMRVDCAPMKNHEIPRWCIERARAAGKRMDMATARLLVELAGANLGQVAGQIENLVAYCRERNTITRRDVEELVGGDHARKTWELTDAVMNRDAAKALKAFDRLTREPGSAEFALVPALAGKLRKMLTVKHLTDKGHSLKDIGRAIGSRHEYPVKLMQNAVRNSSLRNLVAKYQLLLQADVDLKTLPSRERRWIAEQLILRLCGLDSPPANS